MINIFKRSKAEEVESKIEPKAIPQKVVRLDDNILIEYVSSATIPEIDVIPGGLAERHFADKVRRKNDLAKLLAIDPERALNEIAQHLGVQRKRL